MQESTNSSDVLTLVDGSYLLHQGFYAFQSAGLRNPRSEPVGALYGFMLQLERIVQFTDASHMAVMFDSRTASESRKKTLPKYKSNRHCPDELVHQFQKSQEALSALGYHWNQSDHYEADDLIATYARRQPKERAVCIVSTDKDLLQLVDDQVTLLSPAGRYATMGKNEVMEKWGVRPDQMGYLIALMGDSADVIPGVPRIGQKRGAALLQRYEDLEGIMKAAEAGPLDVPGITEQLRQNLLEYGWNAVDLYEKVVKLQDVPLEESHRGALDLLVPTRDGAWRKRVEKWCDQEAFKDVKKMLLDGASRPRKALYKAPPLEETGGFLLISSVKDAERVLKSFHGECYAVSLQVDKLTGSKPRYLFIYGGSELDVGCVGNGKRKVVVDFGADDSFNDALVAFWCRNFLADPNFKKVYHCFSELRRCMQSSVESGVDLAAGLQADTMHMARLWDPSLEEKRRLQQDADAYSVQWLAQYILGPTWRMKQPGLRDRNNREEELICFNANCSAGIFYLHEALKDLLEKDPRPPTGATGATGDSGSMWGFYEEHWQRLAKLLSDVELRGMHVNEQRLAEIIQEAETLRERHRSHFCNWATASIMEKCGKEVCLDALNLNSADQLRQLFFGSVGAEKEFIGLPITDKEVWTPLSREDLRHKLKPELEELCREKGCKMAGKKEELIDRLSGLEDPRHNKAKRRMITIPGLGLPHAGPVTKQHGQPQVTLETIQSLMQLEELGSDGVEGVGALWQWRRIESRLSGFLKPLQSASCEGRVYPQINLNTMTGRVSTRNPNLQGEPTGEGEDDLQTLAVRSILAAPPGRRLLVADYAQLELRLVAHLANCSSMIEILSSGGDIHSRTAYKMFQEVKSAVDQGLVLLDESDTTPDTARASQASQASLELVKDHFPELRKKAKTLNFSLLYGKTKYSFAKDWKITEDEAQVFIDRWFQAFPEVKDWMDRAHATYRPEIGGVEGTTLGTILGRFRRLRGPRHRALRVAGNTPVQGSGADVVLSAMVKAEDSVVLQRLGFQTVLQIHDELVLEGPENSAEEALGELVRIMEDPLPFKLKVPLKVDAKQVQTWFDAKA